MPNNMLLSACVRATLFKDTVTKHVIKGIAVVAAATPVLAHADNDIADMITNAATGAKTVSKGSLEIAQMLGVLAFIGGLIAMKSRKDNPQIKISHIAGALVVGACLVAVPELMKRSQSQIGLAPISVG
jgi:glucose uptake protein GlcU